MYVSSTLRCFPAALLTLESTSKTHQPTAAVKRLVPQQVGRILLLRLSGYSILRFAVDYAWTAQTNAAQSVNLTQSMFPVWFYRCVGMRCLSWTMVLQSRIWTGE